MAKVLYLPSTPLNVLVCAALANARRETDQAELWLIDQKQLDDNPYLQALQNWPQSPFKQIRILPGKAKGRAKLAERKANFGVIRQGLKLFQPDVIAVGSDRRIEFQYAIHQLKKHQPAAQGWYLDDGLYSYAGRRYHPIKDGINSLIKKLSYGLWWQEPKTVGASNWINQAWLFQPQQAVELIKRKTMHKLESDWFSAPEVQALSQAVTSQFDLKAESLSQIDYVIIVPHPNNQLKMRDYASRIIHFVSQLSAQGKHIAVKYHPRQEGEDDLGFSKYANVRIIPTKLAFEFVLPLLPSGSHVIGDVCTAMLTTKWLRSDLEPIAVLNDGDPFQQRFLPMLKNSNIMLLQDFNDLLANSK
ncbi:MAG: hypothetical protein IBX48_08675 [Thiomicrospira sp.]|uniref:polysialyltransferase family glycosyltransferase n=1 Tax=Thiomicrospira sp. TaxID=935 RepID=UPI001A02C647|nr:polysialyltransferase family glycosyltransferase [Thiomicrospira sp.]MBE0494404.1 hypothetical protein [Thiomicrospira sp.]